MGYKPKVCVICGQTYEPRSGKSKYCRNCAPSWSDKKAYDRWYREHFSDKVALGKAEAYQKRKDHYREVSGHARLLRRRQIQVMWGRVGGLKGTWVNRHWETSERKAVMILKEQEAFDAVSRLNDYFPICPFDLVAQKEEKRFAFQVTMRTHQTDCARHRRLAEDLGLQWRILYIRPDLTKYIIKSPYEPGVEELTLTDMNNLKEVVV